MFALGQKTPARLTAFPKALREAGGHVISELRREWKREKALIEAQANETIAKMRADYSELQLKIGALHLEIERLNQVIKGMRDRDVALQHPTGLRRAAPTFVAGQMFRVCCFHCH